MTRKQVKQVNRNRPRDDRFRISRERLLNSYYYDVQGFMGKYSHNERRDGESHYIYIYILLKKQIRILELKNTISEMEILLMGLKKIQSLLRKIIMILKIGSGI